MSVKSKLSNVYTDLLMLRDGEWEIDESSVDATISMIEQISEELEITPEDLRETSTNQ